MYRQLERFIMDSEDEQDGKSVWRYVDSKHPNFCYGKQVRWIGSKCGQTAMLALSPGGKPVESAHSLGKQALRVGRQYGKQYYQPCRVHNTCRPCTCGVPGWMYRIMHK